MSGVPRIETRRLILEPLQLADADRIQELFNDWEVVKLLSDRVPWPYPDDGAYVHIRDSELPAIGRGESWSWTLRLKTAPERIIGAIDLKLGENENRGFWLAPPWRGQRLMQEAADAVTDFWFNELKFPVLRAPKAVANTASRRISEKQGMRLVATEERNFVCGRMPAEIWEITAEEWNESRKKGRNVLG